RHAFLERHVGERVRHWRSPHHAERVDRPLARRLAPLRLVLSAERADRAREVMGLATGGAALDQELALGRGGAERLDLRVCRWCGDLPLLRAHEVTPAP